MQYQFFYDVHLNIVIYFHYYFLYTPIFIYLFNISFVLIVQYMLYVLLEYFISLLVFYFIDVIEHDLLYIMDIMAIYNFVPYKYLLLNIIDVMGKELEQNLEHMKNLLRLFHPIRYVLSFLIRTFWTKDSV